MAPKRPRDDSPRSRRGRKVIRRGPKAIVICASIASVIVIIVVAAWMVVHFTKSRRTDPRLIGTWKSDADATIAEMCKTRSLTDEQEQKLRTIFGKMKITYKETTFTSEMDGVVDTQTYQVVSKDSDSVVLKAGSGLTNKDEQIRIRFSDNDTYWIEASDTLRECFRRQK